MSKCCRTITVIEDTSIIGKGVAGDPYRRVIMYWSLGGELLATRDTWVDEHINRPDMETVK